MKPQMPSETQNCMSPCTFHQLPLTPLLWQQHALMHEGCIYQIILDTGWRQVGWTLSDINKPDGSTGPS